SPAHDAQQPAQQQESGSEEPPEPAAKKQQQKRRPTQFLQIAGRFHEENVKFVVNMQPFRQAGGQSGVGSAWPRQDKDGGIINDFAIYL
ncbi:MAG: hypothetical protein K2O07_05565, partial [Alistipes sp.]|nr:hypothetical protein [Alistipes sp.]